MQIRPNTPINIAIEIPDFDPAGYGEAVRDYHVQEMAKHAARYAIPAGQCHVVEGLPEDAIPRVADELDAQLVVLGSVGRTGLTAALIGNTAEHIIDRLGPGEPDVDHLAPIAQDHRKGMRIDHAARQPHPIAMLGLRAGSGADGADIDLFAHAAILAGC